MSNTKKWIIDCDIGDDIDDLFALEYAIASGLDIVGITTVFRSSFLRAKLAKLVVSTMGKNIPVFAGEDFPRIEPIDSRQKIDRWLSEEKAKYFKETKEKWLPQFLPDAETMSVEHMNATDYIINTIQNGNSDIGIIAIGPLTNIAKCIETDRDCMSKVSEIVLMGANIEDKVEWNIALDPESAKIVFDFPVPIVQIGSNITWDNTTLSKEQSEHICQGENAIAQLNRDCVALWRDCPIYAKRDLCMHDCLPIFYILEKESTKLIKGKIEIGISESVRGMSFFSQNDNANLTCIISVDKEKYDKSFLGAIENLTKAKL